MFNSTNLPKEIMGFPDFPIPKQEKSYISAEDMLAFLNLYSEEFHVKEQIKFQHYVIRVRPKGEKQWEVRRLDFFRFFFYFNLGYDMTSFF